MRLLEKPGVTFLALDELLNFKTLLFNSNGTSSSSSLSHSTFMPKPEVQKIKIRKSGISVLDIELRSFLLSPLPSKCIITVQLFRGASRSFCILPRDWMGSCETSVWLRRSFVSWHVGKRAQAQLL